MSFIRRNLIKSMRFRTLIFVTILAVIPPIVMQLILSGTVKHFLVEQRVENLQRQGKMLCDNVVKSNYLDQNYSTDSNVSVVNAELNQLAGMYDGRILVIDSNFRIITDTYSMDSGKICISRSVISCFKGNDLSEYSGKNGYIEITIPVKNANSDINNGVVLMNFSTDDIDATLDMLFSRAFIIECIIILVSIILAILWSKSLVMPFKKIEKTIEKISDGYSDEKIVMNEYVETERLGEAFNHMLERIRKSDESRQEFVSNVSHELKTPITSIKVLAESLLMQENVPEELYKEFLTDINNEVNRESQIITDLLTMVKLEKKTEELTISQVNVNDMIEMILKRIRPLAAKRNIELVYESFRPVIAEVDDMKLSSAISNLVENAVKYNIEDGWVRVSLNADHQYLYIKVADSGVGIPQEAQEKIFERFYRVDKNRSRETGGTGLGLAITKNVIAMHQGAIRVYSKENEGTTFSVRIPLTRIKGQNVK